MGRLPPLDATLRGDDHQCRRPVLRSDLHRTEPADRQGDTRLHPEESDTPDGFRPYRLLDMDRRHPDGDAGLRQDVCHHGRQAVSGLRHEELRVEPQHLWRRALQPERGTVVERPGLRTALQGERWPELLLEPRQRLGVCGPGALHGGALTQRQGVQAVEEGLPADECCTPEVSA